MTAVYNTNIKGNQFSIQDASQALALKKVSTPNYRYLMHRLSGMSPEEYSDMEYDLSESGRIIDVESLVASAFRKKRQLILKDGYVLKAENTRNLEYIKKRLEEFEYTTSQTFRDTLSEVTENVVNFHNCFMLKYRNEESTSGNVRTTPTGSEIKPIAGLFVLAAPTIDTATNPKTGRIIKYRHRVSEQFSKQFKPTDIYHISENKRVGMTIGTPPLEAVKDDILALRSIEQSVETLIYRNSSPFIHVKVGNEKQRAGLLADGTSEIDIYNQIIENMDQTGGATTPGHVEIKAIGAESQALRLEGYLKYYKSRVLAGLCISETDLATGDSTTGGSAVIIHESLRDDIRAYQDVIGKYFTNYIFTEILLEAPFYRGKYFIPEAERVELKFLESDIDKRIKIESHYLNLFNSGLITREAAIKNMKYTNDDLGSDDILEPVAKQSTNNLSNNNNISSSNQYSKSYTITDSVTTTNSFGKNFITFYNNTSDCYPDMDVIPKRVLLSVFNKSLLVESEHGVDQANQFIDNAILEIIYDEDYE